MTARWRRIRWPRPWPREVAGRGSPAGGRRCRRRRGREAGRRRQGAEGRRMAPMPWHGRKPAALVVSLAGGYSHICGAATAYSGKNVLPRVAALLDVMVISDDHAVVSADTFERPIYAGNAIQTVKSADAKRSSPCGPRPFEAAAARAARCGRETVSLPAESSASSWVEDRVAARSDRPELTSAKIIISGGRGVGSKEKFQEGDRTVWPTSSAPPSAPRARRSTPAMRRTTGRSARPARSSPRSSTSPSAFRAPSSIWPA
jgi:electron transfer flavoprotein alpha subunit